MESQLGECRRVWANRDIEHRSRWWRWAWANAIRIYRQARRPRVPNDKSSHKEYSSMRHKLYRRPGLVRLVLAILIEISEKIVADFLLSFSLPAPRTPFIISCFYGFLLSSLMSYFYAVYRQPKQPRCHYRDWEEANHFAYNVLHTVVAVVGGAVNGIVGCSPSLRCDNT